MRARHLQAAAVAAIAAMVAAQPAAAQDLTYRYRAEQLNTLRAYSGQPYWHMLSECAGMYGGLVAYFQAKGRPGQAEAAKNEGVAFLKAAINRLAVDRGISGDQAREIAAGKVAVGRGSVEAMLAEPPSRDLTHEQVVDLFCTQVSDAHRRGLRFVRR